MSTLPTDPSDLQFRVPPYRGGRDGLPVVRTYDGATPARWWPTRISGDAPSGDPVLDAAHDNVIIGLRFFKEVLGRDSINGSGAGVKAVAHDPDMPDNAAWTGAEMVFGDGDGELFKPFAHALDVAVHEMAHGVTQHTASLEYQGQSGALNESFSDVFGEAAEQWHENRSLFGSLEGAKQADWLIGEDMVTTAFGTAIRDMRNPGTAYDNDEAGADPQGPTMDSYVETSRDNGGVHINSGIPNKAAYDVAQQLGTEKLVKIWYDALETRLTSEATFEDAAHATVASAKALYDAPTAQAVQDAWTSAGVIEATTHES